MAKIRIDDETRRKATLASWKAAGLARYLTPMGIYRFVMTVMTPDPGSIPEGSPGATRWVWTDRGQIKVSGRFLVILGPPLGLTLLIGFMAMILAVGTVLFTDGQPAAWQVVAMAATGGILGLFAVLAAYNRLAAAIFGDKGGTSPAPVDDGDD